jgi:hypothetical protein
MNFAKRFLFLINQAYGRHKTKIGGSIAGAGDRDF